MVKSCGHCIHKEVCLYNRSLEIAVSNFEQSISNAGGIRFGSAPFCITNAAKDDAEKYISERCNMYRETS